MASTFEYLQQLQRFLREQKQDFNNPADLLAYINRARREVAARTQCIRRLTPIAGQVVSANLLTQGLNYVQPIATITPPDFPSGQGANPLGAQATALVQSSGGTLTDIEIAYGGDGYFEPQITIMDANGPGAGATATLNLSPINTLNVGQEVYPFNQIYLGDWPGVDSVYAIKSVSVIYADYRYSLPMYAFSVYQAYIRQYPFQYQYVPTMGSQFGQGTDGSFYLYPLPSQTYQVEFDCFCLPQDMDLTNGIPDTIPLPWSDAVPYFAAQLAMIELGNFNAAVFFEKQFDQRVLGYSTYARPGRGVNLYGRY